MARRKEIVTRNLGLVRGITVRSRSFVGTIGGALQTLAGRNISMFTELCEESRKEAYDLMVEHAAKMARMASSRCATNPPSS